MSQEIWVKEMPDCCEECPFNNEKTYECVLLPNFAITPFLQSCPLKSIHDHDRELVKKVLDKVKKIAFNSKVMCDKDGSLFFLTSDNNNETKN